MKDIIRFILRLVQNPIVLAILWFGVAIRGFWVSWTEGLANNYLIFSRSFFHALEQTPLYVEYPKEYFDLFLYGIPFTLLIAPFQSCQQWWVLLCGVCVMLFYCTLL